jgi:HD-GYP domain-containing protein (c-di-GMP phosphodiesterase class II)
LDETAVDASLDRLVAVAEMQDGCSVGHSQRVMRLSCLLGLAMSLGIAELRALRLGALLHDVGKVGVPEAILSKHTNLSIDERSWVRKHPKIGHELLRYRRDLKKSLPSVLLHHERLDGSGYPFGLSGNEIPLSARVVAVADVFDAMASARPYRRALSTHVVLAYLRREAELGRLDREIVGLLADSIDKGEVGTPAAAWAA